MNRAGAPLRVLQGSILGSRFVGSFSGGGSCGLGLWVWVRRFWEGSLRMHQGLWVRLLCKVSVWGGGLGRGGVLSKAVRRFFRNVFGKAS